MDDDGAVVLRFGKFVNHGPQLTVLCGRCWNLMIGPSLVEKVGHLNL
jgi:hypothetical protein